MLSDETLFAYFVIGPGPIKGDEGSRYVSKNVADDSLRSWFRNEVSMQVRRLRLNKENIKPEVARWLMKPFRFEARKIGAEGPGNTEMDKSPCRRISRALTDG